MKIKWRKVVKNEKGIALILVLLTLAILLLTGLIVASTSTTEVTISDSSEQEVTAYYLAETGLNQTLAMIRSIQNGDLNDLLAGPDGTCDSPCNGNWANTTGTHPLTTRGNELVIDNSSSGTGSTTSWASVDNGKLLIHSRTPTPLFSPGVMGFQAANPAAISAGGDGAPGEFVASPSGSWTKPTNLQWAGKQERIDPVRNIKYVTLVELYDDDDPMAQQFNAWNQYGYTYPGGYTGTNAALYGTYSTDPNASSEDSKCGLDGNNGRECPGTNAGRSFGSTNRDFNNKIAVRATGRILRNVNGSWRMISESVVDAVVGFLPYPAVVTGNCIKMFGSADIEGTYGSLFSNASVCKEGGAATVSQFVGSAGAICGTLAPSQAAGQPPLFIPDFKPIPDRTTAPYDDGPQAAPYANPALNLQPADTGAIQLQFARGTKGSKNYRMYPGDFWLRQIATKNGSTPTGDNTLNPNDNMITGGYILLQARGTAGSRRTCLNGTTTCMGTNEDGILSRLGISEADLDALQMRVARVANPGGGLAGGNSDPNFTPANPLIIRLHIKKGVTFNNGSASVDIDVIDRTRIFVASMTAGGVIQTKSSLLAGGPKSLGSGTIPTFEFYRIVPGVVAAAGGNVANASNANGLGQTLSSYNDDDDDDDTSPSNQSESDGPGDTSHGFSVSGSAGSCSGTASSACDSCGTCPPYADTQCTNPYGGTWTVLPAHPHLRNFNYFLDGNFTLTGIGSNPPIRTTLIATGHLDTTGNNKFQPIMKANLNPLQPPFTSPTIQFLFGSDLKFGGNVSDSDEFEGLAYAREQISGTGNGTYNGQLMAADKRNIDNKVTNNSIGGSYQVNFNTNTNVLGTLSVQSWRKLKF